MPLTLGVALVALLRPAPTFAQQVIVDNGDASGFTVISGTWNTGAFGTPFNGDYRWVNSSAGGTSEVEWRPVLPQSGDYLVEIWYVAGGNRATDAPFTINHATGSTTVNVNQQIGGEQWSALGTFSFNAGSAGNVRLTNNAGASVVIGDAVRFTLMGGGSSQEFRGMWATRFEWPSTNLTTVQNNIVNLMNDVSNDNFNAVLLQVRGQADTLYPSPNEPWSPILSPSDGQTPSGWGSFDPLAFAITEAHTRGLELHAYINTHTCWQSASMQPPNYNLSHLYWSHCNASDPNARDWLIHDDMGNPVQFEESDYAWLAPGVPDVQAYIRTQVMYVVQNYDVDGVHFDRIRTPGTQYSHDPISEARFTGDGNPDGLAFGDWTRDQFTRFLRDLYAQIMEVKPWVKVSSAPLGLYESSRYPSYPPGPCGFFYGFSCVYQDAQAWLAAGAQDFIVPQIYWADNGTNPEFSEVLPDWVANNAGRHIYAGQITSVGNTELISQINATRSIGGQGNVVFSYTSFTGSSAYTGAGGPYETPAVVPAMPWKDSPTQGIIIGTITDANGGAPIVDAQVVRTGSTYTALSSADGLYSFLLVNPGTYTLNFDKTGVGTAQVSGVSVTAGAVTRVDVQLGTPPPPGDYNGDGVLDTTDHESFAFCLQGPGVTYASGNFCLIGDMDADLDIDEADFAALQPFYAP